jgi:hypothetical protein
VIQPITFVVTSEVAPVVAAEILLRHGFDDDRTAAYLLRTWPFDENAVVEAAHVLVQRESTR